MLFKVVNTPLKASRLIQEKFNCINGRKVDETMPIMQVNRENITSLPQKKTKVATTTKSDDNVPKPGEIVPKPAPSLQAPETTSFGTIGLGKRERVPLTHSDDKVTQPKVLQSKSNKKSRKAPTVPSTPVISEPSVATMPVRLLVHGLEQFFESCTTSEDANVAARLPDAQKHILTFIGAVTTDKFET